MIDFPEPLSEHEGPPAEPQTGEFIPVEITSAQLASVNAMRQKLGYDNVSVEELQSRVTRTHSVAIQEPLIEWDSDRIVKVRHTLRRLHLGWLERLTLWPNQHETEN